MRDRDREWYGSSRGRFDRDDDDRGINDDDRRLEERGWRGGNEPRWGRGQLARGYEAGGYGGQRGGGEREWERDQDRGGWGSGRDNDWSARSNEWQNREHEWRGREMNRGNEWSGRDPGRSGWSGGGMGGRGDWGSEANRGNWGEPPRSGGWYGREDMAWGGGSMTAGYGASRPYSTGFYGGGTPERNERDWGGREGRGFRGGGHERPEDMGLLERAGAWLERKLSGKAPKGYRRSDERIREDVCDLLMRRPEVDASDVDVQVKDGEVFLTGTVTERRMKRVIEDLAEEVLGVDDVHNHVKVRREGERVTTTGSNLGTSAPNGDRLTGTTRPAGEKTRPQS